MILMDTGPLVALCDPSDYLNAAALKHLKRLSKYRFLVCEPVICEACFHLPHGAQRARLREILERLDIEPLLAKDLPLLWNEVFDWLQQYADPEPDWTDAYLASLCGLDRKLKLWTYDKEFRTIWRRSDGSRIPLATS
jgi:predicted nucleic acid-binding protein